MMSGVRGAQARQGAVSMDVSATARNEESMRNRHVSRTPSGKPATGGGCRRRIAALTQRSR